MKRKIPILVALMVAMLAIVPGGQASTGASGTDATDDVLSKLEAFRHKGLYAKEAGPHVPFFDIKNWSFDASAGFMTASIETHAPWPNPGALGTTPEGQLPVGTSVAEMSWVYNMGDKDAAGNPNNNVMNTPQVVGISCTDKKSEYPSDLNPFSEAAYHPVEFEAYDCWNEVDGPWHGVDGWSLVLNISVSLASIDDPTTEAKDVAVRAIYDWEFGWYNGFDAAFWTYSGTTYHDRLACKNVNFAGTIHSSKCEPQDDAPATGSVTVDRANNKVTLKVPYGLRLDDSDDLDGFPSDQYPHINDEKETYQLMRQGNYVNSVSAGTFGTVMVKYPPEPLCWRDYLGELQKSIPPDPVGLNLHDPNTCTQGGVGATFGADWAPGNPFTNAAGGVQVPAQASSALGIKTICVNVACAPNWGGFTPRSFPRARSYTVGLNAAGCAYPAGFAQRVAPVTNDFDDVNTYIQGTYIDTPPDGTPLGPLASSPGTETPVTGGSAGRLYLKPSPVLVPSGSATLVPVGGAAPCFNTYLEHGLHWNINSNGFTAG